MRGLRVHAGWLACLLLLLCSSAFMQMTHADDSSTGVPQPEPAAPGCDSDANVPSGRYVCGCHRTVVDPDSGANETVVTYPSGRLWDPNAQTTSTPWDTSVAAGNQISNYIDMLSNQIFEEDPKLRNVSDFKLRPVRPYPMCYGGSYPRGFESNCLQQFDIAARGRDAQSGYSDKMFCEGTDKSPSFIKGDTSPPICLVYGGGNHLQQMRFYPQVDQFALFTIQSSFNSTTAYDQLGHVATTFQVELNGKQSPYRHRYGEVSEFRCLDQPGGGDCVPNNDAMCIVVPFHTLVIKMTNGVVDALEWDDDDSLCNNDHSVDGNCAIPVSECQGSDTYGKENTATATDCDFKIYVSWSGTDSDGTFLSSSQRRLSQFRRWSLNAVYNQASNFDTKDLPTVPSEE